MAAAALVVAGCGSSSSTTTSSSSTAAAASASSTTAPSTANAAAIGLASSAKLGQVAVDSAGRTLYVLTPESTSHLLCTSTECLQFWPPVTVPSSATKLQAGAGVHGSLAILHRSNGMLQVTLNGLPLYTYANDHATGEANGQGIASFGGTWHAVSASGTAIAIAPAGSSTPRASRPTDTEPTAGRAPDLARPGLARSVLREAPDVNPLRGA